MNFSTLWAFSPQSPAAPFFASNELLATRESTSISSSLTLRKGAAGCFTLGNECGVLVLVLIFLLSGVPNSWSSLLFRFFLFKPPFAFPFSSQELSELLSLPPAGLGSDFFVAGDLAAGVDEAFGFSFTKLELFCPPFPGFNPATGVPAVLDFLSSSLELSDELLLLLAAAAFFPAQALLPPGDLLAGFTAGLLCSSSLLELSESELLALGTRVQGLDAGLAVLLAGLAGGAFFSSSELLELLSESELLWAFFATAGGFLAAGGAGLTAGFAGVSSSELSESELSEEELEPFFACPDLAGAFAGLAGPFAASDLAVSLVTTFSSSELESESLSELDPPFLIVTAVGVGVGFFLARLALAVVPFLGVCSISSLLSELLSEESLLSAFFPGAFATEGFALPFLGSVTWGGGTALYGPGFGFDFEAGFSSSELSEESSLLELSLAGALPLPEGTWMAAGLGSGVFLGTAFADAAFSLSESSLLLLLLSALPLAALQAALLPADLAAVLAATGFSSCFFGLSSSELLVSELEELLAFFWGWVLVAAGLAWALVTFCAGFFSSSSESESSLESSLLLSAFLAGAAAFAITFGTGADLAAGFLAVVFSSSSLELSSLLEEDSFLDFFAGGPLGTAFRFLASGDFSQ